MPKLATFKGSYAKQRVMNTEQETQLSQRPRDVPSAEFFLSLKFIRIYIVQGGVCKFLLAFHCNCVSILYRF